MRQKLTAWIGLRSGGPESEEQKTFPRSKQRPGVDRLTARGSKSTSASNELSFRSRIMIKVTAAGSTKPIPVSPAPFKAQPPRLSALQMAHTT